jgi:hypothetical protein
MLTLAAKTAAMTRLRWSSQLRHASPGAGHKRRRSTQHVSVASHKKNQCLYP